MADKPAFDKGLESMVAEMLRVHLVDAIFSRDAVRNGLPPERVEALRRDIVERLRRAEEDGRAHRESVRGVVDAALWLMPGGGTASAVVQSILDRLVPRENGRSPEGEDAGAADHPEASTESEAR